MATYERRMLRPGAELHVVDSGPLPESGRAGSAGSTGGAARAVIFLHGAGMDHEVFAAQAAALQQAGHRTVQWDLRGHGASSLAPGVRFRADDAVDDLTALIDHLELEHPILVGHSLGGNLAQRFVRRHPERAAGLIVIGATWNDGPLSALERFGLAAAGPLLRLIPTKRLPAMMARASAVTPEGIAQTEAVFARMTKPRFIEVWSAMTPLVAPDAAHRTPVPLALIRGADDRTGNIATAMPRWAAAEGVTERVIPGAGHVVMLDAPEATSRALQEIIDAWSAA